MKRILVGFEESATVREEFAKIGWDAWSCDLQPTRIPGKHFQCDIFEVIDLHWDMAIFFPPCTHLASSGARWFKEKGGLQEEALNLVRRVMACKIPRWAIENPVGVISSRIRKPTQYIQPWQFGTVKPRRPDCGCATFQNSSHPTLSAGVSNGSGRWRQDQTEPRNVQKRSVE